MNIFLKTLSQIHIIIALRSVMIIIQIVLLFFVSQTLHYQLPTTPLCIVIALEILFTFGCYSYYRNGQEAGQLALFLQLIADIVFLVLLLYFTGGATNAFVSLLLIPIAIAAVTLPLWMLAIIAVLAIAAYSFMLWMMPMHVMHGNMEGHFIGMWINFLFSTSIVALVVSKLARSIHEKELAIAHYREEQLKQEKITALGIASAQVTHQLATPLATAQLLVDELNEEYPQDDVVIDLQKQIQRCAESLHTFRQMTFDIKTQDIKAIRCENIVTQLQEYIVLNYPEIRLKQVNTIPTDKLSAAYVLADGALLPAIFNLMNNAVRATKANHGNEIVLTVSLSESKQTKGKKNKLWCLSIQDFGTGFTAAKLKKLGLELVDSEQGLGMAVFLSHASLERLGGKLTLANHPQGGALVTLTLPLISDAETFKGEKADVS
jgi:two-component system sensor histidine kinase RegB